ncbi:MAG: hypothetical protein GEU79_13505, partial [Acidimicrobiia bacterium]|nr:hypothetical protein [Acidimicrobiia bacterium]
PRSPQRKRTRVATRRRRPGTQGRCRQPPRALLRGSRRQARSRRRRLHHSSRFTPTEIGHRTRYRSVPLRHTSPQEHPYRQAETILTEEISENIHRTTSRSATPEAGGLPNGIRKRITELIRSEAESENGQITMKMNSLVDAEMIEALYDASQAGTQIDLIVRGICCLRPGDPEYSKNITVRSLVGRYLEHSRIYRFGREERQYLIGSADLMPRNLDRRVEALTPITDSALQLRLDEVLDVLLADDELAWVLDHTGAWTKVPTEKGVNAHVSLQGLADARGRFAISGTPAV